jgi:hypothetical protein
MTNPAPWFNLNTGGDAIPFFHVKEKQDPTCTFIIIPIKIQYHRCVLTSRDRSGNWGGDPHLGLSAPPFYSRRCEINCP